MRNLILFIVVVLAANPVVADEHTAAADKPVVTYTADFFTRYRPNTALDMVRQLPGFQLDDGDDRRGFGGSAGNLLINDRYLSAKQDKPSLILLRIPADQVERIELIRGQVRDIDLQGEAIVANLVLVQNAPAAISWEFGVRKNFIFSPLAPNAAISIADTWGDIEYNFGVDARRSAYGDPGFRYIFDGDDTLTERRTDQNVGRGYNANLFLNGSTYAGETLVKLNTSLSFELRNENLNTLREPQNPTGPSRMDRIDTHRDNVTFEFGLDAERTLAETWVGKGILLFSHLDQLPYSVQANFDENGDRTLFRRADTDAVATELIGRLEFDWTGITNHIVQFNFEAAKNELDSSLVQIVDSGSGPEVVPVPGANSRVEETRGDILISDTWNVGNVQFDVGLGAESSTISQSGDAQQKRSFFFVKPHAIAIYSASQRSQTRLRVAREVAQLDFEDFVSATDFVDDDLAFGNPDLKPETTWIAELGNEWRLGAETVVKATLFHHWVSDVQDLLPIDESFEVPGNIGDGRRWGVEVEARMPLDAIGLRSARLDIKSRWQDSTVRDPVTGNDRVLSADGGFKGDIELRGENRYALQLDFRQDLEDSQISWGWNVATRAERPLFKVNELDVHDEGVNFDAFIETSRWFGIKMRLSAINILDYGANRDRTIYDGERALSAVSLREARRLHNGERLTLTLSGAL